VNEAAQRPPGGQTVLGIPVELVKAAGAGLGLLGFVVLVGGGITWARFDAVGLPADQAVYAIPKFELVTIGAVALAGFTVLALIVSALLYLIDSRDSGHARVRAALVAIAGIEVLAVWLLDARGSNLVAAAVAAVALGSLSALAVEASDGSFLAIGLPTLAAIALFCCVGAFLVNREDPQVQPVAVLLKSGRTVEGIYVARNDDRILLGRIAFECDERKGDPQHPCRRDEKTHIVHSEGRMVEIPRDQVSNFAVGPHQSIADALPRLIPLGVELELDLGRPRPAQTSSP
jgi:hypothetical protein